MTAVYTPRLTTVARTVTIQFSASEYVRQCHDSVIQSHTHPTHAGPHYRACRRPPTYFTHDESSIVLYHTRGRRRPVVSTGATTTSSILHGSGQGRMQTAGGRRPRLPPPQKKSTQLCKKIKQSSLLPTFGMKSQGVFQRNFRIFQVLSIIVCNRTIHVFPQQ